MAALVRYEVVQREPVQPLPVTVEVDRMATPRCALAALVLPVLLLVGAAPAQAGSAQADGVPVDRAPLVGASLARLTGPQTAYTAPTAANLMRGRVLGSRVTAALSASGARSIGAAVDVDGLGPVLRRDAARLLPPASTQKSFVVGAALLALPAETRLATTVAVTHTVGPTPVPGRLDGSLYLVAGGDPYLTRAGLRALAAQVTATGITHITGDIRLDDSRYDARRGASGWRASWVPSQSGPLSAMAVDRNRWRTDRAFLLDPALPAAVVFRDQLRATGIRIDGTVRRAAVPADAGVIASSPSAPLSALASRILKDSDNFAAELLLKELGRSLRGEGSSRAGLSAVRDVLGQRGVSIGAGGDGSGLSSLNRQSAGGSLALLRALDESGVGESFRAALPVACQDGTLRTRMCGTPAAGRLAAKTGTLQGIRVLAGYTTTASGRRVRFVFSVAGASDGNRARIALDRAAAALAGAPE